MPSARKEKPHRIGGVVRNGEAGHVDVADGEAGAGLESFEDRHAIAPGDGGRGQARNIDRNLNAIALLGEHREAGDVIGMFVSHQDRG